MNHEFKNKSCINKADSITKRDNMFRYLFEEYGAPLTPLTYRLKKGDDPKYLGKRPYLKNWQFPREITCYEDLKIDGNRQNAGIVTGDISRLIIVDVDDSDLFSSKHKIPDTFTVKTGKGYHHYFRIPYDRLDGSLMNRSKQEDGFDIRANGGCVVAPGSIHATSGNTYRIIDESVPVAEAPKWVLELSTKNENLESKTKKNKREDGFLNVKKLEIPKQYTDLLESTSSKQVDRSKKLWILLKQMVSDGCDDDLIISAVHYSSGDINDKYSEKGAKRAYWLLGQIEKARAELLLMEQQVITKVEREPWVQEILSETVKTLEGEHKLTVTLAHKDALEEMIRLYVALLEGSLTGWFCIPLGVGTGKTTVIMHIILFLWKHRHGLNNESLTVAVQKIDQIKDIEKFLLERGVDSDFFSVIHSKKNDLKEAKREANQKRIVIVTHQRLNSLSFTEKFFTYKDKRRNLLIYDEQLSNGISAHSDIDEILSMLDKFNRKQSHRKLDIPLDVIKYLCDTYGILEHQSKKLIDNQDKSTTISLPSHYLEAYEYYELLKLGNEIDKEILKLKEDEINWISLLLTLGKTDDLEKDLCLFKSAEKENGKDTIVVFSATELLSNDIENLVTTDATRSYNRLFRYTLRTDLKCIKMYQINEFRTYEGLKIHYGKIRSGRQFISEVFNDKIQDNPQKYPWTSENIFIELITELIKANPDKRFLIFHSKQLGKLVKTELGYSLALAKVYESKNEYEEHVKFRTFGMHDATNDFSDCSSVIFLGLHRKPRERYLADIYAETLDMSLIEEYMVKQVEMGDLTVMLQQGTGRGAMRKGEAQDVYFFDLEPERFTEDFLKAFPGCSVIPWEPECLKVDGTVVAMKKPKPLKKHKDSTVRQRILDFRKAVKEKLGEVTEELEGQFSDSGLTPVKFLKSIGAC